jgi:4-amino-4-deoxychorismate lyase
MTSPSTFLINGDFAAALSPNDRGFAYGDGVFRTFRVELHSQQSEPAFWKLHYKKLAEDCRTLGITCPHAELLLSDIRQLFKRDEDAIAKIVITRGISERGYASLDLPNATRVVIKSPVPKYPESNFDSGVRLHLCNLRLSKQPRLAGIKHLNRLENVIARTEWVDSTIADGLLLDEDDRAIECTMSNLFARFDTVLATPDLSRCGVAGLTRSRILDAAPRLGMTASIADLPLEKLLQADEIIICNSIFGAWQVVELAGQHWQPQGLAANIRLIFQE